MIRVLLFAALVSCTSSFGVPSTVVHATTSAAAASSSAAAAAAAPITKMTRQHQRQQHQVSGTARTLLHAASRSSNEDNDSSSDYTRSTTTTTLPETSAFGSDMVPEGQRPANEYLDLVRAPLFGWASEEVGTKGLMTRLVTVYAVVFWVVCYPIAGATFTQDGYEVQKLAASNVGGMTLTLVLLFRLYTGWGYVGSRLKSKVIEYEETGWYDGDMELKSVAERQRDMFLYQQNVRPAEDRLTRVSLAAAIFWVLSLAGYHLATTAKPIFNEYDPTMLEQLRYNDKLADDAAAQSFSRPTYCDNRYYRAVANGGQGCEK